MTFVRPFFWASTISSLISILIACGWTTIGRGASEMAAGGGREANGGAGMLDPVAIGGGMEGPPPPTVFRPSRALRSILGLFWSDIRGGLGGEIRWQRTCQFRPDTSDAITAGQE